MKRAHVIAAVTAGVVVSVMGLSLAVNPDGDGPTPTPTTSTTKPAQTSTTTPSTTSTTKPAPVQTTAKAPEGPAFADKKVLLAWSEWITGGTPILSRVRAAATAANFPKVVVECRAMISHIAKAPTMTVSDSLLRTYLADFLDAYYEGFESCVSGDFEGFVTQLAGSNVALDKVTARVNALTAAL